jgi:hypothetical protein
MVALAAACLAFAVYYRQVSAVTMYDSNFQVFHEVLSADDRQGILRTAQDQLSLVIVLLAGTNLLWVLGVGASLLLGPKSEPPACE